MTCKGTKSGPDSRDGACWAADVLRQFRKYFLGTVPAMLVGGVDTLAREAEYPWPEHGTLDQRGSPRSKADERKGTYKSAFWPRSAGGLKK